MSHTHQIEAENFAEFKAKVADLHAGLFGLVGVIPVQPATTGKAPRGAKANTSSAPAQSETPATSVNAAVGDTATIVPPDADEPEDDGLGDDEPAITREDVKALLIEAKNKFKDQPTLVGELVNAVAGKYGAKKLADVKDEDLPALHAAAKKKLG